MNRKTVSVLILAMSIMFLTLALHDIGKHEPDVRMEWVVVGLCALAICGVLWSWWKPRHR